VPLDAGLLNLVGPFGDHGLDLGVRDVSAPAPAVVVQIGIEYRVGIRQVLDPILQPRLIENWRHGLGAETAFVEQTGLNLLPDALGIALALLIAVEGVDGSSFEDLAALLVGFELDPVAVAKAQFLGDLGALVVPDDGGNLAHRQISLNLLHPQQLADQVPRVGGGPDGGALRCRAVWMEPQGERTEVEADVGLALAAAVSAEEPAVLRPALVEELCRRPGTVQENLAARVADLVIRQRRRHDSPGSVPSVARTRRRSGRSLGR